MITLTPAAAEQIRRAATGQADGDELPCLRIAAKLEDGEITYGMGFDDQREHDSVIDVDGITVLIAPRSAELLSGATLDFVELQPGEFQFIFINPNEPGGCGSQSSGPAGSSGGCGSCGNRSSRCN